MSRVGSKRQVFVVEDDQVDERMTRKQSQDELVRKSSRISQKDFQASFDENTPSTGIASQISSFLKTPKGQAIAFACVIIAGVSVLGLIAGIMYYVGYTVNTSYLTTTPNMTTYDSSIIDSVIMTQQEKRNLIALGGFRQFSLCFRASRDGFLSMTFHRLCDNRIQTVSVVRSHMNSVFGGYTAQTWTSTNWYKSDTTAFLFSLRRRGVNNSERFNVSSPSVAIYTHNGYGPTFGNGHDLYVVDNADFAGGSATNYCNAYACPPSFTVANMYLSGITPFNVTDYEVFQVTF